MDEVSFENSRIEIDIIDNCPELDKVLNEKEFEEIFDGALEVCTNFLFKSEKGPKLDQFDVDNCQISLTLCDNEEIRELNNEYRGKDKATDVISFQVIDSLRPGEIDEASLSPYLLIGDIVISKEVAKAQAEEFEITYVQEIVHLFVHGFLHLCGYDHEISDEEETIMFALEEELVAEIYKLAGF